MASSDVRDILELDDSSQKRPLLSKEALLAKAEKKKGKRQDAPMKRPENIPREVWHLHADKGGIPSLMPTEQPSVYKQARSTNVLGRVRPWKWTPFKNSARKDGAVFYHWRRACDVTTEGDYYFAKFNKKPELPSYTEAEYAAHLSSELWSREETDYLLAECSRFDLRFVIVHDRWDKDRFRSVRSLEDIKERYYSVLGIMDRVHSTNLSQGFVYDAAHERRRRDQLSRLYSRTAEQVEEENQLVVELKKIELRKREREKKTQDLQKLISQADSVSQARGDAVSAGDWRGGDKRGVGGTMTPGIRKRQVGAGQPGQVAMGQWDGLKFPDVMKNPGIYLRSQKMKLPTNLGQKKTKIIECFIDYFQMDPNPPPTEEIVEAFNELRSDVLLLHELRAACNHCDYELQSMRLKFQQLAPGKPLPSCLQPSSTPSTSGQIDSALQSALRAVEAKRPKLSGSAGPSAITPHHPHHQLPLTGQGHHRGGLSPTGGDMMTPARRRRAAALGQGSVLKRLKIKSHANRLA